MLAHAPTTVAECDERIARLRQARRECSSAEHTLIDEYDRTIDELLDYRAALVPEQRT